MAQRAWLGTVATGRFDLVLAVLLATLATPVHLLRGEHGPMLVDLMACTAAALTTRWPRGAGLALGIVLAGLLFVPPEWASLGEYAALIPILGTGMRGQRRTRTQMAVGYGAVLAALAWRDLPGDALVIFAIGVWVALIAVLWGIGDLFTTYRTAQQTAHAASLQRQRLTLARELHDTVARDLYRASLRAQSALAAQPSAELEAALAGIQQASAQLRWMLELLRDPSPASATDTLHGNLDEALDEATGLLETHGFSVVTSIEGDLAAVPPALVPTLRAVIGEACANIERHADPSRPSVVIVSANHDSVDAMFLNETRDSHASSTATGVGLAGVSERLALVGGELATEQEGRQWITRVTIPL